MYNQEELKKKITGDYWKRKYSNLLHADPLRTMRASRPTLDIESGHMTLFTEIPPLVHKEIARLCNDADLLVYTFYLSALNILIYRYSGLSAFYVNTTQFSTDLNTTDSNNLLVCNVAIGGELSFKEIYTRVKAEVAEVYKHQDADLSDPEYMLPDTQDICFMIAGINQLLASAVTARLVLKMEYAGDNLLFKASFHAADLDPFIVSNFTRNFVFLLENILKHTYLPVDELDVVNEGEKQMILQEFNMPAKPLGEIATIQGVFERQVERSPDAIALVTENGCLTYAGLNEQANQLAHYLRERHGVADGSIVAVMLEQGERLIIGILGILKAGGAYLPVDPQYPAERKTFLLADSAVNILLTDATFLFDIPSFEGAIIALDLELPLSNEPRENVILPVPQGNSPAYIIYTSGSTGVPKGVVVGHTGFLNMITEQIAIFGVQGSDRVLQFASPSFDASVSEIFMALLSGAGLVLMNRSLIENADRFIAYLRENGVSVITLPPAYLKTLEREQLSFLKVLITAGEKAVTADALYYSRQLNYFNAYGPTECSVCVSIHKVNEHDDEQEDIPIGNVIASNVVLILNKKGRLVPVGGAGEICVSGRGLAIGYLNRPLLTAERFADYEGGNGKIYRTGDIGRFRADGNLEYGGRGDDQVKVRGYRVELSEISQCLRRIDGVAEAEVLHNGDELVGYVVSAGKSLDMGALRAALGRWLPSYMVPGQIVQLDRFPLSINGKLDKQQLLAFLPAIGTAAYKAPESDLESGLVTIWESVLEKDRIGVSDNFFETGGHSLKAVQMLSRIHKELGIKAELKDIFNYPTIEQLAIYLSSMQQDTYVSIPQVPISADYALSHAQQRLWLLDQLDPEQPVYNIAGACSIEGALHVEGLKNAFTTLISRHEILRTVFPQGSNGEPRQVILSVEEQHFQLVYTDLRGSGGLAMASILAEEEAARGFSLSTGPLIRARLLHVAEEHYLFLFTMHHIISDGWSMDVLTKELFALYSSYTAGRPLALPSLAVQYKDYANWQNGLLSDGKMLADRDYWLDQLKGELPVLHLQEDYKRPDIKTYNGRQVKVTLDNTITGALKVSAQRDDVSPFMILLSLVYTLLHRYTGSRDLIVGTTVAGREHHDLEEQIGFYVNTLPLRCAIDGNMTFGELLAANRDMLLDAYRHQYYPFDKLVEDLQPERNSSRSPLFDVLVEQINVTSAARGAVILDNLKMQPLHTARCYSKFDLTFRFIEQDDNIELVIEYNTDLYLTSRIERMGAHFVQLLKAVLRDPFLHLKEIPYLSNTETAELLTAFNETGFAPSSGQMWLPLFEEQVLKSPDATAVYYAGGSYSYSNINELSNKLARHLRSEYGIKPGMVVGLLAERSAMLVAGVLGILKAGGTLLPIDVSLPAERKKYILSDAGVAVLLTTSDHIFDNDYYEGPLFALDLQLTDLATSAGNLAYLCSPQDIAYILYTSGSTGMPKGVAVSWQSMSNYLLWANLYYFNNQAAYPFALFTALSFDLTITSLFTPLLRGDMIYVCREGAVNELLEEIFDPASGVKAVKMTPAHVSLLRHLNISNCKVEAIILGGEALTETHVSILQELNPLIRIYNEYGPTEATVGCVVQEVTIANANIAIGRPIYNTRAYVLDEHMQLLPKGYRGTLWIGGECLAKGYHNNAILTADRFRDAAFKAGERIYCTGDMVSYDEGGVLWYHGRSDDQIKLRGYRIEPGEISQRLLQIDGISDAVVLLKEQELVGYLVGIDGPLNINEIRATLGNWLPSYMVPAQFVQLDALPLNVNGKVDKQKLLADHYVDNRRSYKAPSDKFESHLVAIWEAVLERENIGVLDNFFESGGHSLKAIQILTRIHKELGVKAELKDIFNYPTIERLASYLSSLQQQSYVSILPVPVASDYALSPAQQRLWLLHQLDPKQSMYNIAGACSLEGTLDVESFERAFGILIARHEILRTIFIQLEDGTPRQRVLTMDEQTFRLAYTDLRGSGGLERARQLAGQEVNGAFSLSEGPLLRARLFHVAEDRYLFVFTMHHIISDGWSMDVLNTELFALYNSYVDKTPVVLPELHLQYKDYANWQYLMSSSDDMSGHRDYWLDQLKGELPVLNIPEDHRRAEISEHKGAYVSSSFDLQLSEQLKDVAQRYHVSSFQLLLSILQTLFYRYTGQTDMIVGVPVAGRQHADLQSQIGIYVNTIALRTIFNNEDRFSDLMAYVRTVMLNGYLHQDYPFDKLVEALNIRRDLSRSPVFDIMVNNPDILLGTEKKISGLNVKEEDLQLSGSKYDMTFYFSERNGCVNIGIQYNTGIYDVTRMKALLRHFEGIAGVIVKHPDVALNKINFLQETELKALLSFPFYEGNENNVKAMFERQVMNTPLAAALICGNERISYADLNDRATRLKNYITQRGITKGNIVAVSMTPSVEAVVAVLAILKAGAVLLPLDLSYPERRKQHIINDTGVALVITDTTTDPLHIPLVNVLLEQSDISREGCGDTPLRLAGNDPAYIMYTSGSTGEPKGVLCDHATLADSITVLKEEYELQHYADFILTSGLGADPVMRQIFVPLTTGACLHVMNDHRDVSELATYIVGGNVEVLFSVPSTLRLLADELEMKGGAGKLRFISSGSESLEIPLVRRLLNLSAHIRMNNMYGPTEVCMGTLHYRIDGTENQDIPIGKPFAHLKVYLLDAFLNVVPVGYQGELYISGRGVKAGYLNQPGLTAERFIDNPFSTDSTDRVLYKTGDLAISMWDGNLKFAGRIDNQIKFHGFRIEPEEIEQAICSFAGIKRAVVQQRIIGRDNSLVAWYQSAGMVPPDALRNFLQRLLPTYMIPSLFVHLEVFPLLGNGKADRVALANRPLEQVMDYRNYVAPRTMAEQSLAGIWESLLLRKQIGIFDNFFTLGGHSLKAAQLVSRILKELGVQITLKDVFKYPDISSLAALIEGLDRLTYNMIMPVEEQLYYEVSHAQKRLWILDQLHPGLAAYNMCGAYECSGQLNVAAFSMAIDTLVARHEILRTVFIEVDGVLKQRVLPANEMRVFIHSDISNNTASQEELTAIMKADAEYVFDLGTGPLLRAHLVQYSTNGYLFILTLHHIICDGWSIEVLRKELLTLYAFHYAGGITPVAPLRIQYRDYAHWQNRMLASEAILPHSAYWNEQFSDTIPLLKLPFSKPRPVIKSFRSDSYHFVIDDRQVALLDIMRQECGVSLHAIVIALFKTLLFRYTGEADIVIGTPVAGRSDVDLEDQIGCYINMLPIRTKFTGADSFEQLLLNVQDQLLNAQEHAVYPFDRLVEDLPLQHDMGRSALFDILINNFEGTMPVEALQGLTIKPVARPVEAGKYDITLHYGRQERGLFFDINYNTDLFDPFFIKALASHLQRIVTSVLEDRREKIGLLKYLSGAEETRLLSDFSHVAGVVPSTETIPLMFEAQVSRTPAATALVFGEKQFSYEELNREVNKFAHHLREVYTVCADEIIAIMLDPSERMIIALFGILKSGAAFLPISPDLPRERVLFMLRNAGVSAIVTDRTEQEYGCPVIDLAAIDTSNDSNPAAIGHPTDLAYIIFTSGTTGQPKGAAIANRSLVNYVNWFINECGTGREDSSVLLSTYTFDGVYSSIWGTLLGGGSLHVLDAIAVKDPGYIVNYIYQHNISFIKITPSLLHLLLQTGECEQLWSLAAPRLFVIGGEAINMQDVQRVRQINPAARIINHYGPTETTIAGVFNDITADNIMDADIGRIIGRPIPNVGVYILDDQQQLLPVGVQGEIYIGGAGLGRGYINAVRLTAEKFIQSPFGNDGGRLYRTGDLGRRLPDGRIEFAGRKDTQVKIRGYRIELEEIRYHIKKHEQVEEAVLMVQQTNEQQDLICYVKHAPGLTAAALQQFLGMYLPVYMLPSRYISIDIVPVTKNGKIDLRALQEDGKVLDGGQGYVAPKTAMELFLAGIWSAVLQRELVGTTDNFFEIGGHSLKAIQVLSRIHKELGTKVTLRELFTHNNIEALSGLIAERERGRYQEIIPVVEKALYEVSHAQKRLWVLDQLMPGQAAYNMSSAYLLEGVLNLRAMQQAFTHLIMRHEILRTVFIAIDGEPLQKVLSISEQSFRLEYLDAVDNNTPGDKVLAETAVSISQTPFSLAEGPLVRAAVVRIEEDKHVFFLVVHHIISDGWSMLLLAGELKKLYLEYSRGIIPVLPPLSIQYKDYANWQQTLLRAAAEEGHRAYWLKQLQGPLPVLDLPPYKVRPSIQTFNGALSSHIFSKELTRALQEMSNRYDVTMFMLLISISDVLFYRYSGERDIILGTSVAGRDRKELEDQIGIYLNTVALRCELDPSWSFDILLMHMKRIILDAFEHQAYPFDLLVEELKLARDMSRSPVFDVLVEMQNFHGVAMESVISQENEELKMSPYSVSKETSQFDLNLMFHEQDGALHLSVNYNTDLFDIQYIERLIAHFEQLAIGIVADQQVAISNYALLTSSDRALLQTFNATERPKGDYATVLDILAVHVTATPGATALVCGREEMTYAELGAYSDALAGALLQHSIVRGDMVAVLSRRNLRLPAVVTGIMKSGAVYLPLGVNYPDARLREILLSSGARCLLVEDGLLTPALSSLLAELKGLVLITIPENSIGVKSTAPLALPSAADLSYVIYTSGSTGKPKGAMVEHAGMLNHLYAKVEELSLDNSSVVAQNAAATFDISIWQMFAALMAGGKTVIYPDELILDPESFLNVLQQDGVTVLEVVPSYLSALLDILEQRVDVVYPSLSHVLVTGETLPGSLTRRWFRRFPGIPLVNAYGPTEASDDITHYHMTTAVAGEQVPLGHVLRNLKIYIVDEQGHLCPIGVKGEICVSGVGVGRGYLNDDVRTAEVFLEDPYREERGVRMYRTGDIGRYRLDGLLEYYGRKDSQIKLRGYRIELGEIEHRLQEQSGVRNGVVLLREGDGVDKSLVCWVELEEGFSVEDVKMGLGNSLPAYMVPDIIVPVASLPLTTHGKVDRQRLQQESLLIEHSTATYTAAADATEKILQTIWGEVLGLNDISTTANFFELGGHSLKATRIVAKVRDKFQVQIALRSIFIYPTVKELAKEIRASLQSIQNNIVAVQEQPYYEVSHAQRRLWILDKFEEGQVAYNLPAAVTLKGNLDINAFEQVFKALVARHEILRTTFIEIEGIPWQKIHPAATYTFNLELLDVSMEAEDVIAAKVDSIIHMPFDLEQGPLLRACLLQQSSDQFIFLLSMHHIISDGWSMEVLIGEILSLYKSYSKGLAIIPAPLSIQYKDYAAWQNRQLEQGNAEHHKTYWLNKMSGEIPVLHLPADQHRPPLLTSHGATVTCSIDKALNIKLRDIGRQHGASLFMVLLAAVKTLLYRYTHQEDIIVGSPIAGRDHHQLEDQIGFYVNTLALRTQFKGTDTFAELLENIREVTLGAYDHQLYPFDRLVDDLRLERDMSRSPLFDVMVALENLALSRQAEDPGDIAIIDYPFKMNISKFDLSFDFYEHEEELLLRIAYNTDIYGSDRMERMARHCQQLLTSIAEGKDQALHELVYLSAAEELQLLDGFNDTTVANPISTTILDLFNEQVLRNGHKSAVVYGDSAVSYQDLDLAANQLAHYLLMHYRLPDQAKVGIMVERSERMMGYILAILKMGAAYVPIDPDYPEDRIKFMIADSGIHLLLTDVIVNVDGACSVVNPVNCQQEISQRSISLPDVKISGEDLAYIIYTSGSTGQPKGVMVEHHSLLNIALGWRTDYGLEHFDVRLLQVASISFDVFCGDLCRALLNGGTMFIASSDERIDPIELCQLISTQRVNIMESTPGLIIPLMEHIYEQGLDVSFMKLLILGSDVCPAEDVRKLYLRFGKQLRIVNSYGTTEATIDSSFYEITTEHVPGNGNVPIGYPMRNTQYYILDAYMRLLPVGVPGELYIAGEGVARGYLNNEELTAARFLDNPYREGARMYRTGDIACRLEDGAVALLGRNDRQVKLRGYRIELGEIEQRIMEVTGVKAAVVLVKEHEDNGHRYLVAWVILNNDMEIAQVKEVLGNWLPAYMVPDVMLPLAELPLTQNGKVDRGALQEQVISRAIAEHDHELPETAIEKILAEVWEEVLGQKNIGLHDSFFGMGGDSIKAIQISSRMFKRSFKLEVRNIMANETIAKAARFVKKVTKGLNNTPVTGNVLLTPSQWDFFANGSRAFNHYNQSVLLSLDNSYTAEGLSAVFNKLLEQHDALRMIFRWSGEDIIQHNENVTNTFHVKDYQLNAADPLVELAEIADGMQAGFDITVGPLMKVAYLKFGGEARLLIIIHHLVIDGVSWRILFEDLDTLLEQYKERQPLQLPGKSDSFKTWAEQLHKLAEETGFPSAVAYWKKMKETPGAIIKRDMDRKVSLNKDEETIHFEIDGEMTAGFLSTVNYAFNTRIDDLLLAALVLGANQQFKVDDLPIMLEGHGREDIVDGLDISRTVGWFTAEYPVLLSANPHKDLSKHIREVKETIRKIPDGGIGYGMLRYGQHRHRKNDLDFSPQICFNYLGEIDAGTVSTHIKPVEGYTGKSIGPDWERTCDFEIIGAILEKKLRIAVKYSPQQYYKETVQAFGEAFMANLHMIYRYCLEQEQQLLTPSDISDIDMSIDDFNAIFED